MNPSVSITQEPLLAAEFIKQRCPGFRPKIGLILGSGLGDLANQLEQRTIISYAELPGFPISTVPGHAGKLHLGYYQNIPVACLQGRAHLYEGISANALLTMIRTLKLIGCEILLLTNSAGSLRPEITQGSVLLITDHINLQFSNPLVGPNDERFGDRFTPMEEAYNPELNQRMRDGAKQAGIKLAEGVYIGVLGPSFETPAEIRAFAKLGADVVGMSTVPEVIAARHCGLKVVALSAITNLAAGLSDEKISHELTLAGAEITLNNLTRLITQFISSFTHAV